MLTFLQALLQPPLMTHGSSTTYNNGCGKWAFSVKQPHDRAVTSHNLSLQMYQTLLRVNSRGPQKMVRLPFELCPKRTLKTTPMLPPPPGARDTLKSTILQRRWLWWQNRPSVPVPCPSPPSPPSPASASPPVTASWMRRRASALGEVFSTWSASAECRGSSTSRVQPAR